MAIDVGASSSWIVPVAGVPIVNGASVLSSTETLVELRLVTARSGRPSPLKSLTVTEKGPPTTSKGCWAAKEGVAAPAAVVLSSTDTMLELKLAVTRSGRPSPLRSPAATVQGPAPVAKVCWAVKDGVAAPGAVVLNSTDTVLESWLAVTRSG